jgi:2-polyprenyl-3-methyl-5-hydroxy-6-metoxy-1,4-benzoquinol methylase
VEPRTGDRVVDLGCVAGAITHFLSGFGCKVAGVDLEERAVRKPSSKWRAGRIHAISLNG